MVYRNNTSRLGTDFISVSLETRWLGQNRGIYESEPPCISDTKNRNNQTLGVRVTRDAPCRRDQTLCTTVTTLFFVNGWEFGEDHCVC